MRVPRRFLLLAGGCLASILAFGKAGACKVFQSFYELGTQAEEIVIARVVSVEGEPDCYCQKATLLVERSFKGKLRPGRIALPFIYQSWPDGSGMLSVSGIVPVTFEARKRYLLLLARTPPMLEGDHLNPFQAPTEYWVFPYPENTLFEIRDDGDLAVWEVERLLRLAPKQSPAALLETLRPMLAHSSAKVRLDAVEALTALDAEGAVDSASLLSRALRSDPDEDVRWRAASGLTDKDALGVVPALMETVEKDSSALVRHQAVLSLSSIRAREALPLLLEQFDKTIDPQFRSDVIYGLPSLAGADAPSILAGLYPRAASPDEKWAILNCLSFLDTEESDRFVLSAVEQTQDPALRERLVFIRDQIRARCGLE